MLKRSSSHGTSLLLRSYFLSHLEHERLLWELQDLAKEPQRDANSNIADKLNLIKTQILLFERLMIGKKIGSLVILVNHYVEKLSEPRVEISEVKVQ